MASGKGHNKGFHYYMSKKFFHPGNPINLEAVFIARQNHERAKREEAEKMSEYQREQEAYEAKETLAIARGKTQEERNKLSLSFMYDPPVGVRGSSFNTPTAPGEKLTMKGKGGEEEGEPFCFYVTRAIISLNDVRRMENHCLNGNVVPQGKVTSEPMRRSATSRLGSRCR